MKLNIRAAAILARRLFLATACTLASLGAHATTVTLIESSHNAYGIQNKVNYDDTTGRAYSNPGVPLNVNTALGFDFSSLPDLSNITAMTLTVNATAIFGTPIVQVNRSNVDAFTSATGGASVTLDELLGKTSPTALGTVTFTLDPTAVNWTTDLQDNRLTLVLSNPNTAYSFLYFDVAGPNAPTLAVTYSPRTAVPEPSSLPLVMLGLVIVGGIVQRSRR